MLTSFSNACHGSSYKSYWDFCCCHIQYLNSKDSKDSDKIERTHSLIQQELFCLYIAHIAKQIFLHYDAIHGRVMTSSQFAFVFSYNETRSDNNIITKRGIYYIKICQAFGRVGGSADVLIHVVTTVNEITPTNERIISFCDFFYVKLNTNEISFVPGCL